MRRIMGLDLGARTIGVAVSDPGRSFASSLGVVRRRGLSSDLEKLAALVREHDPALIVLGLPLHLSGRESEGSRRSREFAKVLHQRLGLEVVLVDESLTTRDAEDVLIEADLSRKKRKKVIDGLAAAFILQSYLNELHEAPAKPRGQDGRE
jgi:putative Holliday junction resolvase